MRKLHVPAHSLLDAQHTFLASPGWVEPGDPAEAYLRAASLGGKILACVREQATPVGRILATHYARLVKHVTRWRAIVHPCRAAGAGPMACCRATAVAAAGVRCTVARRGVPA